MEYEVEPTKMTLGSTTVKVNDMKAEQNKPKLFDLTIGQT